MKHLLKPFSLLALLIGAASSQAELPNSINYQGRLVSNLGTPLADNSYPATFKLYDAPTGGTLLWTETQTVAVRGGIFSAALGKTTAFPANLFGQRLWLESTVDGKTLTPRQELAASPFAMVAQQALGVAPGSVTALGIADNSITAAKLANDAASITKVSNGLFNQSGARVGINRAASSQATLAVAGNIYVGVGDRIGHQVVDDPNYYLSWVSGDALSGVAPVGHLKAYGGWRFFAGGNSVFTINSGGTGQFAGNCYALDFIETSSLRYKKNIEPLAGGLDLVLQLKPVSYDLKASGTHEIGLIAEDVARVLPSVVGRNEVGQIEGLNYGRLSAVLVKAMQEQEKRHKVETAQFQSRLQSLEARLARLESGRGR